VFVHGPGPEGLADAVVPSQEHRTFVSWALADIVAVEKIIMRSRRGVVFVLSLADGGMLVACRESAVASVS
jgi:hypothetical protein